MKLSTLAKSICHDLIQGVYDVKGEAMIAASAKYPDGDFICAYEAEVDGRPAFTDFGQTLSRLHRMQLDVTEARQHRIDVLLHRFGAVLRDGWIMLPYDTEHPGRAFHDFCQVAGQIACLEYESSQEPAQQLVYEVDTYLRHELASSGISVARRWYDERRDPDKLYPVDWRLNGNQAARHIFVVTSAPRVNSIANTVRFFREQNLRIPTLAVTNYGLKLGQKPFRRLSMVTDKIVFEGLKGHERDIKSWVTSQS